MGVAQSSRGYSIRRIAEAAGISRHVVSALIRHFDIPRVETDRLTAVLPEGLPDLIGILRDHPGVNPDFAERL